MVFQIIILNFPLYNLTLQLHVIFLFKIKSDIILASLRNVIFEDNIFVLVGINIMLLIGRKITRSGFS